MGARQGRGSRRRGPAPGRAATVDKAAREAAPPNQRAGGRGGRSPLAEERRRPDGGPGRGRGSGATVGAVWGTGGALRSDGRARAAGLGTGWEHGAGWGSDVGSMCANVGDTEVEERS